MIHELRLYTVVPGRHDVAYARFEHHLPALFAHHGIRNVGRWTATAGPNGPMFVYMMAYRDLAERERQWNAFYQDPQWYEVRAATQGEEEATERFDLYFLKPQPAFDAHHLSGASIGGQHELLVYEVALGRNGHASTYLHEHLLPAVSAAGGTPMLVSDFLTGSALPKVAVLIAWPDATTRAAAWTHLHADPDLLAALADQRRTLGRAALGRTDVYLLEPTPFALPRGDLGAVDFLAD